MLVSAEHSARKKECFHDKGRFRCCAFVKKLGDRENASPSRGILSPPNRKEGLSGRPAVIIVLANNFSILGWV
jgi:hypothetical protein